uniref:BPTI/Kunitz inhibitor domain-containing protein n=1 Tax=Terrapene triunguis TaxID=2587831 RepID=A0A674HY55_9SAUR
MGPGRREAEEGGEGGGWEDAGVSAFLTLYTVDCFNRVSKPGALPQDGMEATTISPSEVRGVVDGDDPCFLGKNSGVKCTSYSLLWYYRVDTGSCDRFWYGGCGGNANRFNSEQDCIRVCIDRSTWGTVCLEDRDTGPCHSFTLKWFFNKTQPARCTPFWYGGCEGNRNRFETRELCESTCLPLAGQMLLLLQQSAGESLQADDESRIGTWKNAQICWRQIFEIAVHPTAPIKPLK